MANIPTPRSYQQILSDELDSFFSTQGISNVRVGSAVLSIFEASSQSQFRGSADIFQLLAAQNKADLTGDGLDKWGADENVPRFTLTPATTIVTIGDDSFTKISTTLAANQPAPIVGTTTLMVLDASQFPNSGSIYIGRGTTSYEGPIAYSAITNLGANWSLTLTTATTKLHNTSETVVVAHGGNRQIGSGTIVQTPQGSVISAVAYSTLYPATLLDGETSISSIQVVCQQAGTIGNCIAGAISTFEKAPFTGATVTNPNPVFTGIDTELDDDYRERIINTIASRALGTPTAIKNAVLGLSDSTSRITSASYVKVFEKASYLYIDDGSGYEMTTSPVPIETIVDLAIGGEDHFEVVNRPVAQAFVISQNVAPFVLRTTDAIAVKVGGTTYIHAFGESKFDSISNASAYEVADSINSDPLIGFMARTANGGSNVVLFSKTDTNDDIQVLNLQTSTGFTDGNEGIQFPLQLNSSIQLYKNDRLLSKDGLPASIVSNLFSNWAHVVGDQTLTIAVDNTPSTTYVFADSDFVDNNTGFPTLGLNNLNAWATVFNARIPGITATVTNGTLTLTSNLGTVNRAAINILGGTLISAGFFNIQSVNGVSNDYTLDRNYGEIFLKTPLVANDTLSIGSAYSRAFIESNVISTFTLASNTDLWFAIDSQGTIIPNGIGSTSTISIAPIAVHPFGHILRITAAAGNPFQFVLPGNWLVLWDPNLDASLHGLFRVVNASNTTVDIERREGIGIRTGHRSVALATSGSTICSVLTCGGTSNSQTTVGIVQSVVTNSAEIYNPNTKLSSPVKPMNTPRAYHTATLLQNGKVLVVGGIGDTGIALNTLEIYDPNADSWSLSGATLSLTSPGVYYHTATLLGNGTVLIAGGSTTGTDSLTVWYIYTPGSDTITSHGTLVAARRGHKATLLSSGDVLIVGGYNGAVTLLTSAEIFSHNTLTSTATGSMTRGRAFFGLSPVRVSPTTVIAVGNNYGLTGNNTYEEYSISGGTWGTETTIPNNQVYENKDVVLIPNGAAVGLYGYNSVTPTTSQGFQYNGISFSNIAGNPLWTDSSAKWGVQLVPIADGVSGFKNVVVAIGGTYQQSTANGFAPTAMVEQYDVAGVLWTTPDPATTASVTLSSIGIAFAVSNEYLQKVTIPSGSNYTASSVVSTINSLLVGGTSSVYKTNKIRVDTNSYDTSGDIALITQTTLGSSIGLPNSSFISNNNPITGFTESGTELGTPLFKGLHVIASNEGEFPIVDDQTITADQNIVGLANLMGGIDNTTTYHPTAYTFLRSGNNYKFNSKIASLVNWTKTTDVNTRTTPYYPWIPSDRVYCAAPFAIAYNDVLNVMVDNDVNKQFAINMFRLVKPTTNTYGQTNLFKDESAGNISLAQTFGLNFNFNDFVAYMPARAQAFIADTNRELLFRYYRPGSDGNNVQVRFGNPLAANQSTAVNVDTADSSTNVTILLPSGAQRALTTDNSTKIGMCIESIDSGRIATIIQVLNLAISAASRVGNVTTLTLTLPGSVTNHGLAPGNLVWINSTNPNFSSGVKAILGVPNPTNITYAEVNSNNSGTNIGDLSFDSLGEATFTGSSTAVNDWFRFVDPLNSQLSNLTFNISAVDSNGRNVTVKSGDQIDGGSLSAGAALNWYPISVAGNLQVWQNPSLTASALSTQINALAAQTNSTCPVTTTLLSSGTGVINTSTPDFLDNYNSWYVLTDGVNWIQITTPPGNTSGDYQLTFKNPVNGLLSSGTDWQNETVYLCPITAQNVVDWLNAPTVTALSTLCNIQTSGQGHKVQIATLTQGSGGGVQVQGGSANSTSATVIGSATDLTIGSKTTISNSDALGLTGGQWCQITNTVPQPMFPWTSGFGVTSWTTDGLVQFSLQVVSVIIGPSQAKLQFEKQGKYIAITDMGMNGALGFNLVNSGEWLRITGPVSPTINSVSSGNEGVFRILRVPQINDVERNVIYIENTSAIEEQSQCTIQIFGESSAMPGDQFVVLDPVFGINNQGVWPILDVGTTTAISGDSFNNLTSFVVDVSQRTPEPQGVTPTLTSSNENLVYLVQGTPSVFIRRIVSMAPNNNNGENTDIRWDSHNISSVPTISAAAGSIITPLDKLNFPLAFFNGVDGYNYATGLIGVANTAIYGDPSDSITYPGIASADAHINIFSSIIKKVNIAVAVRIKTGVVQSDIENKIKSAIATVINKNPVGNSIAFSAIVAAIEAVVGVISAVVVSPIYNITNDLIPVQPQEKTKVFNLNSDIQVSFLGV